MLAVSVILSLMLTISVGQIVDPYMLYGGGLAMYGGMNPYLYSGGLANYGAFNPANLLLNPYNMDVQSTLFANYNAMNSLNAMNGLNSMSGLNSMGLGSNLGAVNPTALGVNSLTGLGNTLDSGNTLSVFNSLASNRGLRNRLPVVNRDGGGLTRLNGNSLYDCTGILSARPCGHKRTVGAGTNWENTQDRRR